MKRLLLCCLLLGCHSQDSLIQKQIAELQAAPVVAVSVPTPSKPTGSVGAVQVVESVPTGKPQPGPVVCSYLVTGHTLCMPCRAWHPNFETAYRQIEQRGYKVRRMGQTSPAPAHFVEVNCAMDANEQPALRGVIESRLAEAVGGYDNLRFPCFYAVDANWNVIRTWDAAQHYPSEGKPAEHLWTGMGTLVWLHTGKGS